MDSQIINCPHCKQATAAKASLAEKLVRCPHCGNIFQIPQAEVKPIRESANDSLPIISINPGSTASQASKSESSVISWVVPVSFAVVMAIAVWNGKYLQYVVSSVTGLGGTSVSGELSFTTKVGTGEKGAGQKVYISPMNNASKKEFVELMTKRTPLKEESLELFLKASSEVDVSYHHPDYMNALDRAQAKYHRLAEVRRESDRLKKQAIEILTDGLIVSQADSEGKFWAVLPPGDYVLWTNERLVGEELFVWCRTFKVENNAQTLLANDGHIIVEPRVKFTPSSYRVLIKDSPKTNWLMDGILTQLAEEFANSPN